MAIPLSHFVFLSTHSKHESVGLLRFCFGLTLDASPPSVPTSPEKAAVPLYGVGDVTARPELPDSSLVPWTPAVARLIPPSGVSMELHDGQPELFHHQPLHYCPIVREQDEEVQSHGCAAEQAHDLPSETREPNTEHAAQACRSRLRGRTRHNLVFAHVRGRRSGCGPIPRSCTAPPGI